MSCPCISRNDIIIVDDNIFNILTLQTILEQTMKLQSDKALNGREALDIITKRAQVNQEQPCVCWK